jgi:hypothetical protein
MDMYVCVCVCVCQMCAFTGKRHPAYDMSVAQNSCIHGLIQAERHGRFVAFLFRIQYVMFARHISSARNEMKTPWLNACRTPGSRNETTAGEYFFRVHTLSSQPGGI